MKLLVLTLLTLPLWAQTPNPRTNQPASGVESNPNSNRPVLTARPELRRPPARQQLRAPDIDRVRRGQERLRSGGAGGDDVGNGGDELRLLFLDLSRQWLNAFPELNQVINVSRIIVTDDLTIDGQRVSHVVVDGMLLLDKKMWNEVEGYLAPNNDPRLLIAEILFELNGQQPDRVSLMRAWHALPQRSGQIWCGHNASRTKKRTDYIDSDFSGGTVESLQQRALRSCTASGLQDCRLLEVSVRGFGNPIPHVTVRGSRVTTVEMSRQDQQRSRCEALRLCEESYEWAPAGQVSSYDFLRIEEEARVSCPSSR